MGGLLEEYGFGNALERHRSQVTRADLLHQAHSLLTVGSSRRRVASCETSPWDGSGQSLEAQGLFPRLGASLHCEQFVQGWCKNYGGASVNLLRRIHVAPGALAHRCRSRSSLCRLEHRRSEADRGDGVARIHELMGVRSITGVANQPILGLRFARPVLRRTLAYPIPSTYPSFASRAIAAPQHIFV
jgi:hypothetical protein